GRPQAVAGLRLASSLIRLATSLIPRPIRMNNTPIAIAMAATPKATTEVNSDACRNEAVCAVWRLGSSRSNSAYRRPPVASRACLSMTIASQYALNGPSTSSPARHEASSETVIFWSARVVLTTIQVATPPMMRSEPITIDRVEAVVRTVVSFPSIGQGDNGAAEPAALGLTPRRNSQGLTIAAGTDLPSRAAVRREAVQASVL